MDWWNIRGEHTPFQWECQKAVYRIDPYGEQREDVRAAVNTANLMASQSSEKLSDSEFSEMVQSLANYASPETDETSIVFDPAILKRFKKEEK